MTRFEKSTRSVTGRYFDTRFKTHRFNLSDFDRLFDMTADEVEALPDVIVVPHDVMSIDADASGFGRCGFCLALCPAERHVSSLSGFAHCDEEHRGFAEDQLLNDMEQLEAERRVARLQLVLGIVDVELDERMAKGVADHSNRDEDEEMWEVDPNQLALELVDVTALRQQRPQQHAVN